SAIRFLETARAVPEALASGSSWDVRTVSGARSGRRLRHGLEPPGARECHVDRLHPALPIQRVGRGVAQQRACATDGKRHQLEYRLTGTVHDDSAFGLEAFDVEDCRFQAVVGLIQ